VWEGERSSEDAEGSLKEAERLVTDGRASRASFAGALATLVVVEFRCVRVEDVPVVFGHFTLSSTASGGCADLG